MFEVDCWISYSQSLSPAAAAAGAGCFYTKQPFFKGDNGKEVASKNVYFDKLDANLRLNDWQFWLYRIMSSFIFWHLK